MQLIILKITTKSILKYLLNQYKPPPTYSTRFTPCSHKQEQTENNILNLINPAYQKFIIKKKKKTNIEIKTYPNPELESEEFPKQKPLIKNILQYTFETGLASDCLINDADFNYPLLEQQFLGLLMGKGMQWNEIIEHLLSSLDETCKTTINKIRQRKLK